MKIKTIVRYYFEAGEGDKILTMQGKSLRKKAKEIGCSATFLCEVFKGKKGVSDEMYRRIIND